MSMGKVDNKEIILAVEAVSKKFNTARGELTILENVSFSINAGEKVAIIGPSGSGKSTLLSLIGLLDQPSSGTITIDGVAVNDLSEPAQARFRNQSIGFIFQSFELIAPFTVAENITAPIDISGERADSKSINTLIERVGLTERKDALPYTLSGGEKQRVAIARALAHNPAIILADEPTGSLDRATGERVLNLLLERVHESGKTLIIITHDPEVAHRMDRVLEIKNGTLYEQS